MGGDEGGEEGNEHDGHLEGNRRADRAQAEERQGRVRCACEHCQRGGEEDREVRDPAPRDVEAQAQACDEGGQEDDVREGNEGRSETREEDREGLPREGPQGLHLRTLRGTQGMGRLPALLHGCLEQVLPTWFCHGGGLALRGLWSES